MIPPAAPLLSAVDEQVTRLLCPGPLRVDDAVREALGGLAYALGACRLQLWSLDPQAPRALLTHEWAAPGSERGPAELSPPPQAGAAPRLAVGGEPADRLGAGALGWVPLRVDRAVAVHWDAPSRPGAWTPDAQAALRLLGSQIVTVVEREELAERAGFDALTGLAGRRLLLLSLSRALARLRRFGPGVAVLFCELEAGEDGAGDESLALAARVLDDVTRASDLVARFSEATFAVLCEDVAEPEEALELARRLRADVLDALLGAGAAARRNGLVGGGLDLAVGAAFTAEDTVAGVLLRKADTALYLARSGEDAERVRLSPE